MNSKFFAAVIILFLFFSSFVTANHNQNNYQWKSDDLITMDSVNNYLISPDGTRLLWTVSKWDLKNHKQYNVLYLTYLKKSKNKKLKRIQLSRGKYSYNSLQWVPGQDKFSFKTNKKFEDTKPGNIWIMDLNGGEPYPVTSFKEGVGQYKWMDQDRLLFIAREARSLYHINLKDKKDTSDVIEDEEHRVITRLFIHNLKKKKTSRLTGNKKPLSAFFLSNNNKYLIYKIDNSVKFGQNQEIWPSFFLMDLKTNKSKILFKNSGLRLYGNFFWSRDNQGFYAGIAHSNHPVYTMASVMKIYWYNLKTGKYREVDLNWKRYGRSVNTLKNGFLISLLNGVHYQYARYYKNKNTWKRKFIKGNLQKNISNLQLAENGKSLIYAYSTASKPTRYYWAEINDNEFVKINEVMDINSPVFKKPLAKTEILTWKGALDEMVEGILYYPIKYKKGKKYPLIAMIHGGPHGADMDFFTNRITRPVHLFAERGAFILRVNYHGSSNYGLKFGESISKHYYEYEIPDIENGVDLLIKKGLADPEKLGVMGWSNGAILGTQLIINSNRYKVASLGAGDVNWISDYGNCAFGVAFDNFYFGGPPWENLDYYLKISPLFKMDKIKTPVLIFHGSLDRAVPYSQGWEFYRALQVIGKTPVRFISFPGEGHGPRKLSHMRRKINEDIIWFDKYLFKTYQKGNESFKKDSHLANLEKTLKIGRIDGNYGYFKGDTLVPEVVKYQKTFIGRFEVTNAQFKTFNPNFKYDKGEQNLPAVNITFEQAQKYCQWLSKITGSTYRLPNIKEAELLYEKRGGNTLDYWAGYTLNPHDYKNLLKELKKYQQRPVLLKDVGSFSSVGDNAVYDLDGNAAEWVFIKSNLGQVFGGAADLPNDKNSPWKSQPWYTGFRVVREVK